MADLKIWKYYDLICDDCGFSRSADFELGMETNATALRKRAKAEGWKTLSEKSTGSVSTICPLCAAKCENICCKNNASDCDSQTKKGYCVRALTKASKSMPHFNTIYLYY